MQCSQLCAPLLLSCWQGSAALCQMLGVWPCQELRVHLPVHSPAQRGNLIWVMLFFCELFFTSEVCSQHWCYRISQLEKAGCTLPWAAAGAGQAQVFWVPFTSQGSNSTQCCAKKHRIKAESCPEKASKCVLRFRLTIWTRDIRMQMKRGNACQSNT